MRQRATTRLRAKETSHLVSKHLVLLAFLWDNFNRSKIVSHAIKYIRQNKVEAQETQFSYWLFVVVVFVFCGI